MLLVVIAQERDAVQDTCLTPHPVQVLGFWYQAHTSALKDLARRAFESRTLQWRESGEDFSVSKGELLYSIVME